jgi:hypothetical protein
MPRLVPLDTANLEMRDFASTARLGRPASIISGPEKFSFKYAVLTGKHRELDALLLIVFGFGILTLASLVMDQRLFRFATVGVVGIYLLLRVIYYTSFKKFARRS